MFSFFWKKSQKNSPVTGLFLPFIFPGHYLALQPPAALANTDFPTT